MSSYSSSDLYKLGKIPQKKYDSAMKYYPFPVNETMLALIDATIFGTAKCGMAIGLSGVYWQNDWATETEKNFLSWEELTQPRYKINTKFLSSKLYFGKDCIFDMTGSQMKPSYLADLLNDVIKLHLSNVKNTDVVNNKSISITKDENIVDLNKVNQAITSKIDEIKTEEVIPNFFDLLNNKMEDTFFFKFRGDYVSILVSENKGHKACEFYMSLYNNALSVSTNFQKSKYYTKELALLLNTDEVLYESMIFTYFYTYYILEKHRGIDFAQNVASNLIVIFFHYAASVNDCSGDRLEMALNRDAFNKRVMETEDFLHFKHETSTYFNKYNRDENEGRNYFFKICDLSLFGAYGNDFVAMTFDYKINDKKGYDNFKCYLLDYVKISERNVEEILIKFLSG